MVPRHPVSRGEVPKTWRGAIFQGLRGGTSRVQFQESRGGVPGSRASRGQEQNRQRTGAELPENRSWGH